MAAFDFEPKTPLIYIWNKLLEFIVIMNQSELSQKFLLDLYLGKCTTIQQPILQILAFEIS